MNKHFEVKIPRIVLPPATVDSQWYSVRVNETEVYFVAITEDIGGALWAHWEKMTPEEFKERHAGF